VRQAAPQLLVQLGQFARDGDIAIGEYVADRSQSLRQAWCGLVEDQSGVDVAL